MKKKTIFLFSIAGIWAATGLAQTAKDSARIARILTIDEVVVTGTRNETDIRHLPMTISVVGRKVLEQSLQPSVLPVLTEQVPGLFTTSRGIMGYGVSTGAAGGMSLRGIGGSPTAGLLVLIDGHPQYMGLMGHPIADAYQTMLADRVEVLRGPASVLYGSNAMGGVINIVTRKMQKDGVKTNAQIGYGSYNTLQTEVSNRIRKGRFSSVVTGSYNRTDGHRDNMEFEQYGGYAKLNYDFNNAWKLWGDVNITQFKASNPGETDNPYIDNDSRITRGMASFALENHYERSSGALSFFYNWGRHKINDGYHPGETPQESHFNSKDRMLGVSWYQSATLFTGNRLTVGFDYQHFGGESWNRVVATGERVPGVDKQMDEFAGYIDFRQDLGDWLSLDAGIRVDHHSHVGTEWIPQGGLSFHLPEQVEMKAMVSKGFRNPTIREMYMFPPQNPDLRPESLMNYELSFSQRILDGALSYGVNIYYIDGDNMIMTVPTDGKPKNVNTGEIENWGVEANIGYRITPRWQVNANYSWLHMENPVVAAPGHKLYAGADFTQGRWRLSTGLQYIKDLYTDVSKGQEKRESFVLWNLRANYRLCRFADIFVKGENLLAQRYEINAGFPMPKATFMGGVNIDF
ncbi:TonB-dependent receptor [uncultured Bacteroides sp.]|jgi:hypothetical protein|uniref:TonB-dependent receptor n=1 Tax=uncultured Bacteroides sp. TaxID=162156 RepID=UPI00280A8175|nr:TonB-dependent receptor [uncultured Bacteroides sp.]